MNGTRTNAYLAQLARELRCRFVFSARFIEETRGHLADAAEAARKRGLTADDAEQEAIQRYGNARRVAAKYAEEKHSRLEWMILLAPSVICGLSIAYIDSRPHWDDTGVTAGMLLLAAALMGLAGPRRPWLWALAIGLWVPLYLFVEKPTLGSALGGLVILAIPMAGAYAGMAVRRMMEAMPGE